MNEVEKYLDRVCQSLSGPHSLRQHLREELREHLTEAVEKHVTAGMSQDEAVKKTIEEFGEPEMVRQGLENVYGRRLIGMMIEKAMAWKEKTMKTGWKWSYAAHFFLAMIVTAQVIFISFAVIIVCPRFFQNYEDLQQAPPALLLSYFNVVRFCCDYWFIWLGPIAIVWAVFEWKCRSETKSMIRLTTGSLVSLALMLFICVSSLGFFLSYHQWPWWVKTRQAESVLLQNVTDADRSFSQLARVVEAQDWPAAHKPADTLTDAFRFMRDREHYSTAMLAGLNRRTEAEEMQRLLRELADLSDDIRDGIRDKDVSRIPIYFTLLEKKFSRLKSLAPRWPTKSGTTSQPGQDSLPDSRKTK